MKTASSANQSIQARPNGPVVAATGEPTPAAGAGAVDGAVATDGGGLCTARLTDAALWSDLPPAVADTSSDCRPPTDGGDVMTTRTCDPRSWAASSNAAETAA